MQSFNKFAIILSTVSLAACVTSETDAPMTPPEMDPSPPITTLFPNATSSSMSTITPTLAQDYVANTVTNGGNKPITLKAVENATTGKIDIEVTALGSTVTLTDDDLNPAGDEYTKLLDDGVTDLYMWTYDGTWDDIKTGNSQFKYFVRFGSSQLVRTSPTDTSALSNTRFYGTIGQNTVTMPTLGTAVFNGVANGSIYPVTDQGSQARFTATAKLDVDFTNGGSVSGDITDLVAAGTPSSLALTISPSPISNGAFNSTLDVTPGACTVNCITVTASQIDGQFYGQSAEEVGGSLAFSGQDPVGGNGYVAVGNFGAKQ